LFGRADSFPTRFEALLGYPACRGYRVVRADAWLDAPD